MELYGWEVDWLHRPDWLNCCEEPVTPWNVDVSHWDTHENSDQMIAAMAESDDEKYITCDPDQYCYPIYKAADELVPVRCVGVWSSVDPQGVAFRYPSGRYDPLLPITKEMVPSAGSDSSIIIEGDGFEIGLWGWKPENMEFTNGYIMPTRGFDGVPRIINKPDVPRNLNQFLSRGAGLPYGCPPLVRPAEVRAGKIEHALALASPAAGPGFVYPATKSDGPYKHEYALPEGSRLRLKANHDLSKYSLIAQIFGAALKKYGCILIDTSGRHKFILEDSLTAKWGGILDAKTTAVFPLEAYEVLSPRYE